MYFMHVDAVVVVAESSSLFLLGQQKGTHTDTHTVPPAHTTKYYTLLHTGHKDSGMHT